MKFPKLRFIDILIILIGAAGSIFFINLFIRDINATLTRLEEQPIGTITFRYNIAQRRFNNRRVWDRLQNNSPIYNGDVIRTDNLSEVTIAFDRGDVISLYSNTLIQIFTDSGGSKIDFTSGELIINTSEGNPARQNAGNRRESRRRRNSETGNNPGGSIVINTGDQRVRVEDGSAIRLAALDDGDLELSINEGTVVLEDRSPVVERRRERNSDRNTERNPEENAPRNTERNTERNPERTLVINTGDQRVRVERGSAMRVETLAEGEVELSVTEGSVVLENTVTDNTLAVDTGRRVRLNSRRDPEAESVEPVIEIIQETENADTAAGRTRSANRNRETESSARQRELLPAPRNLIPEDQFTFTPQILMESRNIRFSWDRVRGAGGYILTIIRENEGFRNTILQTPILTETTYTTDNLRQLTRGNFYWYVEAVRVSDDNQIEQRGQIQENMFIINIPRRENTQDSESAGSTPTRSSQRSTDRSR